jgi:hypothetical protein
MLALIIRVLLIIKPLEKTIVVIINFDARLVYQFVNRIMPRRKNLFFKSPNRPLVLPLFLRSHLTRVHLTQIQMPHLSHFLRFLHFLLLFYIEESHDVCYDFGTVFLELEFGLWVVDHH